MTPDNWIQLGLLILTSIIVIGGAFAAHAVLKSRNENTEQAVQTLTANFMKLDEAMDRRFMDLIKHVDERFEVRSKESEGMSNKLTQVHTRLVGLGGENGMVSEIAYLRKQVAKLSAFMSAVKAKNPDIEIVGD